MIENNEDTFIKSAENEHDIKLCRDLINRVFRETQLVARKDRDMIPLDQIERELSGQGKELYMLCHQISGDLHGTAVLTLHRGEFAHLADIRYLTVDPTYRGRKLGNKIMKHVENRSRESLRNKIQLSIVCHPDHPSERLIRWYENHGFVFLQDLVPTREEKEKWFEVQYQEHVIFKYYQKQLIMI